MKTISLLLCLTFFAAGTTLADALKVASPNGEIVVSILMQDGAPAYAVEFRGKRVLSPSKLGLRFKKAPTFGEGFSVSGSSRASRDETWSQPWGERKYVRDHHNELRVDFSRDGKSKHTFSVRFRVFDDGLGFRYEVAKQRGMKQVDIVDEITEFSFSDAEQTTAWWIPARGWNRYEYIYNTTALNAVERAHTPFTLKLPGGTHISIHEAALVDYAAMTLDQRRPGWLKADLVPWSDGVRVKTRTPFKSPWRTLQISADAVGLLNSDLILNLNEPNKLGDVSWVKPGKYVGIWWGMHVGANTWESGDKHGATTAETKRFMDFAAAYGFDGVLVEGWNIGWDGSWFHNGDVFSFTESYPDFDLPAVAAYGKAKGVRLIGHHETSGSVTNYRRQMDAAYDLYEKHGVTQIKTGYVADGGGIKRIDKQGYPRYEWHDGQFMVGEYLHSVIEAAKRRISINTHEPVKDTGLRRTYPNWITREGARGQEFNAWGSPPNPPEHTAILPYTRMLSGPMDFTPGIFDLAWDGLDAENRVKTTLAKQLALYVVLYSPIQMAADFPKNYSARPDAFQFIRDVPADWEQSKALAGEVGDYVAFARQERGGPDWYLGALTDEQARRLTLRLDFLAPGQAYTAQIYRDGDKADWLTNPYDMVIEEKSVQHGDTLVLPLATSGGAAVRFKALP
ncbi:glycoside hydrolase family 97 protein [Exilibacterium tricleocarpae]|uniref:Glycoside hydrolase family 97 protein n=1 Tax=Exilibacterium tricleocarpae TaxID=2591008 RepID=A0A545SQR9_9GAMM|nr:glycoside hydrolase family 97 protein [Exilibacterium tricleocarpae]TQV67340.1 glycoside hydrolase family 97 protein [Exilibacterium tricleocarpae]